MNKTDTILERLKNQPKPTVDLTESIMSQLPDREQPKAKPARRWQLYAAIAVAASILLLLVFRWGTDKTKDLPVVAQQTPAPRQQPATTQEPAIATPQKQEAMPKVTAQPLLAEKKATKKRTKKSYTPPIDSIPTTVTQEASPAIAQQATVIIPNPAEQLQREFREQTELIRRRGEQVVHRVAAQQQAASNPQYIEL